MIYPDNLVFLSRTLFASTQFIGTFSVPAGTLKEAPTAAFSSFSLSGDHQHGVFTIDPEHIPLSSVYSSQSTNTGLADLLSEQLWSSTSNPKYTPERPGGAIILLSLPLLPGETPADTQRFLFVTAFKNQQHAISKTPFTLFSGDQEQEACNNSRLSFSFSACTDITPSHLDTLSECAFFSALKSLTLRNKKGVPYSLMSDTPNHVLQTEYIAIREVLENNKIPTAIFDKLTEYRLSLFYGDPNKLYLTKELAKHTPLLLISKKRLLTCEEQRELYRYECELESRFLSMGYQPEKRLT